jgi:hypothetical protein
MGGDSNQGNTDTLAPTVRKFIFSLTIHTEDSKPAAKDSLFGRFANWKAKKEENDAAAAETPQRRDFL